VEGKVAKRIKRIAPLQLGKLLAVMYALLSVIVVPFIFIAPLFSSNGWSPEITFIIFVPVVYAVMGFIGGVFGAFVYNLCANWIGGIELEFEGD
jgi:hypothetical protein